ncbi:MAG: hypothetical protein OXH68_08555 [Gammaproteobacteria bacterium]|nr:hypothetical protein [Gammaproteobacteria bacterium]
MDAPANSKSVTDPGWHLDYIELFYNRKRRHSSLSYMSPIILEERVYVH